MAELTLDGVPLSQEKKSKAKTLISNNTNNESEAFNEIQERLQLMKNLLSVAMFLCAQQLLENAYMKE